MNKEKRDQWWKRRKTLWKYTCSNVKGKTYILNCDQMQSPSMCNAVRALKIPETWVSLASEVTESCHECTALGGYTSTADAITQSNQKKADSCDRGRRHLAASCSGSLLLVIAEHQSYPTIIKIIKSTWRLESFQLIVGATCFSNQGCFSTCYGHNFRWDCLHLLNSECSKENSGM